MAEYNTGISNIAAPSQQHEATALNEVNTSHTPKADFIQLSQDINELKSTITDRMNHFEEIMKTMANDLLKKYEQVDHRLTTVENDISAIKTNHEQHIAQCQGADGGASQMQTDPLANTEITVVAKNIPCAINETMATLDLQIGELLSVMGVIGPDIPNPVKVVKYARLPSRNEHPGLVKIAFENLEQKILVLKHKQMLKDTRFSKVWMWGSKTHTERLMEINTRKLLDRLPFGHGLQLASNGRLIEMKDKFNLNTNYYRQHHKSSSKIQTVHTQITNKIVFAVKCLKITTTSVLSYSSSVFTFY